MADIGRVPDRRYCVARRVPCPRLRVGMPVQTVTDNQVLDASTTFAGIEVAAHAHAKPWAWHTGRWIISSL